MEIKFFDDSLEKFLESQDNSSVAKILRTIDLLEAFGYKLSMPHSKKIAENLFELRIHGVQKIRILYTFHKSKAVLIHGFVKKSMKIPKKDLNFALQKLKQIR